MTLITAKPNQFLLKVYQKKKKTGKKRIRKQTNNKTK